MIEILPITPETLSKLTPTRIFGVHQHFITQVAWSADSRFIVSGDANGTLRGWKVEDGTQWFIYPTTFQDVVALRFADTNKGHPTLIVGFMSGVVQVLQITLGGQWTLQQSMQLPRHTVILDVAFYRQSPVVAYQLYGDETQLFVHRLGDYEPLHSLTLLNPQRPNVAFSHDGECVASGGLSDSYVVVWEMESGEVKCNKRAVSHGVRAVTFHPNHNLLGIVGYSEDRFSLMDVEQSRTVGKSYEQAMMGAFTFHPTEMLVAIASRQSTGSIHIIDPHQATILHSLRGGSPLAFSPKGDQFVCGMGYGAYSKSLILWDTHSPERSILHQIGGTITPESIVNGELKSFGIFSLGKVPVTHTTFSADDLYLASASQDKIRVWNLGSGAEVALFWQHQAEVNQIAFSPDSTLLASASGYFNNHDDNSVRLWSMSTFEPLARFNQHQARVSSVAWTPSGELIVSADVSGQFIVWHPHNQKERYHLTTPSSINHLAIDPSGSLIATAQGDALHQDEGVRLWNLRYGELLRELHGLEGWCIEVAFSPDGQLLYALDDRQTLGIYSVLTGEQLVKTQGGTHLSVNPRNGTVLVGDTQGVRMLNPLGKFMATFSTLNPVRALAMQDEGELLAISDKHGDTVLYGIPRQVDRSPRTAKANKRYSLQFISLTCLHAQEGDGDEVYLRLDGQTVWSIEDSNHKMHHQATRSPLVDHVDFETLQVRQANKHLPLSHRTQRDFIFGGMTGVVELELWEADAFLRGGDDFFGSVKVMPNQVYEPLVKVEFEALGGHYLFCYKVLAQ